jgi:hypothetical protein
MIRWPGVTARAATRCPFATWQHCRLIIIPKLCVLLFYLIKSGSSSQRLTRNKREMFLSLGCTAGEPEWLVDARLDKNPGERFDKSLGKI